MSQHRSVAMWTAGVAVVSAVLALAALAVIDVPLALWVRESAIAKLPVFRIGTVALDTMSGKGVSKFLLGGVIAASGVVCLMIGRARAAARTLLAISGVQLTTTLVAGLAKNVFGRLRPYEMADVGTSVDAWFVGGQSFPSGHMAFYCGLCLPLSWVAPRLRWALLSIPVFVGAARIAEGDHYLSDVCASACLAALITLAGGATRMRDAGVRKPLP